MKNEMSKRGRVWGNWGGAFIREYSVSKKNQKTCKSVWEDRQMNEMSKRGIV